MHAVENDHSYVVDAHQFIWWTEHLVLSVNGAVPTNGITVKTKPPAAGHLCIIPNPYLSSSREDSQWFDYANLTPLTIVTFRAT